MDEPTLHLTISMKSAPKARPSFSLPRSATADALPPAGTSFLIRLKLPAPQPVAESLDAAARQWHSRDHTYRFPRAMRPIIAALADGTPLTIQDIVTSAEEELDEGSRSFSSRCW